MFELIDMGRKFWLAVGQHTQLQLFCQDSFETDLHALNSFKTVNTLFISGTSNPVSSSASSRGAIAITEKSRGGKKKKKTDEGQCKIPLPKTANPQPDKSLIFQLVKFYRRCSPDKL